MTDEVKVWAITAARSFQTAQRVDYESIFFDIVEWIAKQRNQALAYEILKTRFLALGYAIAVNTHLRFAEDDLRILELERRPVVKVDKPEPVRQPAPAPPKMKSFLRKKSSVAHKGSTKK